MITLDAAKKIVPPMGRNLLSLSLVMSATVGLTVRLARLVGLFTVAMVAAIPLMTLFASLGTVLNAEGLNALYSPWFLHIVIFGTTYAAVGEMMTSLVCSVALVQLLKYIFTHEDGVLAKRYVDAAVVRRVQENVFSHTTQTSLDQ